jgi:hypothetical protein
MAARANGSISSLLSKDEELTGILPAGRARSNSCGASGPRLRTGAWFWTKRCQAGSPTVRHPGLRHAQLGGTSRPSSANTGLYIIGDPDY